MTGFDPVAQPNVLVSMKVVSSRIPSYVQAAIIALCVVGTVVELSLGRIGAAVWSFVVCVFAWGLLRRVPVVRFVDGRLEIHRGSVVASMEFSNVRSIAWRQVMGLDVISVSLCSPASFGDRFWFIARTRTLLLADTLGGTVPPHPIVAELQNLAREV